MKRGTRDTKHRRGREEEGTRRDRRERWVQGGDTRTHDSASVFRGSFPPLCSLVSSLHISFTYHSPRVAGGLRPANGRRCKETTSGGYERRERDTSVPPFPPLSLHSSRRVPSSVLRLVSFIHLTGSSSTPIPSAEGWEWEEWRGR